ncbi:MAG: pilus assembly protein PilM [Phycisphaerales bacterium]|jgi:type IV pilus assembly protein PilM
MLGFRKKNLVGLDIDTLAVRMVQLRRDDAGYAITSACVTEVAPSGDDPQLRKIHTVRAIQQALSRCRAEGKLAICGLRGPEVVVRGFEFPTLPAEEIGSAVGLEASQICPFSTEESTFDYQVTSTDARKTRGFWVAANNSLIRSTRQLVHEAGLRCAMIDVAGLAMLNCLTNSETEEPRPEESGAVPNRPAVLDIGGTCTTVAIMDHAGRPFVRDIGSGSDEILRRLAANAGVPLEIARTALLNYGLERSVAENAPSDESGPPPEHDVLLWDHLEGACAELVEDIATTLRYYAAQHGSGTPVQGSAAMGAGARVEKLLVCGAMAGVDEFIELLQTKLYIDVAPWNPVEAMCRDADQTPELAAVLREAGSSMALAAGLAMRHI